MNQILLGLKDFVSEKANDESEQKLSTNSGDFLQNLTLECEGIKNLTRSRFLLGQGEKINGLDLINYLQHELCAFRNGLTEDWPHYSSLSAATDNLIDFLREEFSVNFNHELPVPPDYLRTKISEQQDLLHRFREAMDHDHADPMLTEVVDDYLQQNGYLIRKFSQIRYYLDFAAKLEIVIAKSSPSPLHIRVVELLFHINFNAPSYVIYCGNVCHENLQNNLPLPVYQEEIYACLNKMLPIPHHEHLAYDPSDNTLQASVRELVQRENEYLQQLKDSESSKESRLRHTPLITAQMNAATLMVLVEGAVDAKVFTSDTYVDFYAFITEHIGTKKRPGPLSEKALKNRKNETDLPSAKQAVKHLEDMIAQIKKKYKLD